MIPKPRPIEMYRTAEDTLFTRDELLTAAQEIGCLLFAFLVCAAFWKFVV